MQLDGNNYVAVGIKCIHEVLRRNISGTTLYKTQRNPSSLVSMTEV